MPQLSLQLAWIHWHSLYINRGVNHVKFGVRDFYLLYFGVRDFFQWFVPRYKLRLFFKPSYLNLCFNSHDVPYHFFVVNFWTRTNYIHIYLEILGLHSKSYYAWKYQKVRIHIKPCNGNYIKNSQFLSESENKI